MSSTSSSASQSGYSTPITSKESDYDEEGLEVLSMVKNLNLTGDQSIQHEQCNSKSKTLLSFDASIENYKALCPRQLNQDVLQDTIWQKFLQGRSQWMDEPIINSWHNPSLELRRRIEKLDHLYIDWNKLKPAPFNPFFDQLWLELSSILRDAGLPWHNNNLNMPDEVDHSWPFQFKELEYLTILAKARRVSYRNDITGYITNWSEGNYFGIRSLKQEISKQCPSQRPILLTDNLDAGQAEIASKLFGLEWHKIALERSTDLTETMVGLTVDGKRPVIFAATLANSSGESDNLELIDILSQRFPMLLHLDACRVFDYLTTASEELRRDLKLPRISIRHQQLGKSRCFVNGEIFASTIVAGGSNMYVYPPPVAVLKRKLLGNQTPTTVEYVRGTDSTLAGSRDSLGPLMLFLQEVCFGAKGLGQVYESCARKRLELLDQLQSMGVWASSHAATLDIRVNVACPTTATALRTLGAILVGGDKYMFTVQPSAQPGDFRRLLDLLGGIERVVLPLSLHLLQDDTVASSYRVPDAVAKYIKSRVQHFKIVAPSSCGYPLNQAPYSALGPIIGPFLTVNIPEAWAHCQAARILSYQKEKFGLSSEESKQDFAAYFTTGSTMGNRIGLHIALHQHPNAFVYFSSSSHYSVKKTIGDCDDLSGRWRRGNRPRFSQIPSDCHGSMMLQALIDAVLSDLHDCKLHNEPYELILFANMGTTFTGGRDSLLEIGKRLAEVNVVPSFIHVDGALDLGFSTDSVRLGPPGVLSTNHGVPYVQGVTLSHHKAFGIMVSGEVISYCPDSISPFHALGGSVEPRAIFEMWLYEQMYDGNSIATLWKYCLDNSSLLRKLLSEEDIPVRYNDECIITLLERPMPWITQKFHLAPDGNWVHFITMPHISPATINHFVKEVSLCNYYCATALSYIAKSVVSALQHNVTMHRITCLSRHTEHSLSIAKFAISRSGSCGVMEENLGIATLAQLRFRYVTEGLSFIAVDNAQQPLVMFLAGASSTKVVMPSIILVKNAFVEAANMLQDIALQLFGHISRLASLDVQTNNSSYEVVSFS